MSTQIPGLTKSGAPSGWGELPRCRLGTPSRAARPCANGSGACCVHCDRRASQTLNGQGCGDHPPSSHKFGLCRIGVLVAAGHEMSSTAHIHIICATITINFIVNKGCATCPRTNFVQSSTGQRSRKQRGGFRCLHRDSTRTASVDFFWRHN